MGQVYPHSTTLADGRRVGYSLLPRHGIHRAKFRDPDDKVKELSTGFRTVGDAHAEAARLIAEVYRPTLPAGVRGATWADAESDVRASNLRPETVADYLTAITIIRRLLPKANGPADVTPDTARAAIRLYASTPYRKGSLGADRRRSPNTVRALARKAAALWGHFRAAGFASVNPWDDSSSLNLPKPQRKPPVAPTDDDVKELLEYLSARYPDWPDPVLWVQVKELAGCRTLDLCSLRSDQLKDGRLTFDASQTKTHTARSVPLPADLFGALRAIAGPVYLWEQFVPNARRVRSPRGKSVLRSRDDFSPVAVDNVMSNLFKEFNTHPNRKGRPRLTPHGLRRKAITTAVVLSGGSADAAAAAIGLHPLTARAHYLDLKQAFDADALFAKMADVYAKRGDREAHGDK